MSCFGNHIIIDDLWAILAELVHVPWTGHGQDLFEGGSNSSSIVTSLGAPPVTKQFSML